MEDIFSDLLDKNFKYGGENKKIQKKGTNKFQKDLRRKQFDNDSISVKGEEITQQEYSNHSEIVQERFHHMIKNNGEILFNLKIKKLPKG